MAGHATGIFRLYRAAFKWDQRLRTSHRPAFALDRISSVSFGVPAHLPHNRALVVDQPFIVDLVVDRTAIGHDTLHQRFARGLAEHPANQMRRSREQAAQ